MDLIKEKKNWIEKTIIEEKIEKIHKDFYELGKEFYELKLLNKLDYNYILNKYNISKNKINEYINNYLFITKYNINNYKKIGINKIKLLQKIEDENIIRNLVSQEELTNEEILKNIKDLEYRRIYKKCFNFNEYEIEIFNDIKEKLGKELDKKLTNSETMSYIITYFYSNYF